MTSDEPVSRTADAISSDLDALRELEDKEWRLGWSRQFALILLLVAAFVTIVWLGRAPSASDHPIVLNGGFSTASDFDAGGWVATALEQALIATVQAGEQLRIVDARRASTAFSRYGRAAGPADSQWILRAEVGRGDGGPDTATVRLALQRTDDAGERFEIVLVGSLAAIADLALRSAEQLYAWLELDAASRQQIDLARGEIPLPAASEAYGKGLAALAAGDGRAALASFQTADELQPDNAAILEGLAKAWDLLGYASNAARASARALQAADGLSRKRQLELEAQYALRSEAWPRAQQVFAALKEFNPENLDYRLALAETLANQNDGDGFLNNIADMRALPNEVGRDPRIDLTEAWYWHETGDYARCMELARVAERKARDRGNRYALGDALLSVGRCDDTYDPSVLHAARDIFNQLDTPSREPEILRELAKHEFAQGNMASYLSYLEEAVTLSRELGNEPQLAATHNALALAYDLHGWLARGLALKRQVAEYQRERGNLKRYAILLENIGVSLFKMGRYDEAEAVSAQAEQAFNEVDDQIGIAWLPYRRGQIALRRGDLAGARDLMTRAHANADHRPEGNLALEASYELGMISFHAGDFTAADRLLGDANRQYRDKQLSAAVAESEIALARIDLQLGDVSAARRHLDAATEFLDEDAAYYALSLALERASFDLAATNDARITACRTLADKAAEQEHAEYVLRAGARLAACAVLVDGEPLEAANEALADVEHRARKLGVFDAELAAGYVRAALLRVHERADEAAAERTRVADLAAARGWLAHPVPDLRAGHGIAP